MCNKSLKNLLRSIDFFGVVFTFNYKSKETYKSVAGGFFFFLFLLVAIIYALIIGIPVFKREKLTVIDYLLQFFRTDVLNLTEYSVNFGLDFTCDSATLSQEEIWELLELKINYVSITIENGNKLISKEELKFSACTHQSFFGIFNDSYNELGLNSSFCPDNSNYTIQGVETEPIFQYVEIILKSKENIEENFEKIKSIFLEECHLNIYYPDVAFDFFNYKEPIHSFLNSKYLALKFTETTKMNLNFKLTTFQTDDNFIFDKSKVRKLIDFSSNDFFSYYKGESRFSEQPSDFDVFGTIYIKADKAREVIERKYTKLTELAAEISSILHAVLIILTIFVTFINKFYANESVMGKIFQFSKYQKNKVKGIRKMKAEVRKSINKNEYLFNCKEENNIRKEVVNLESIGNSKFDSRRVDTEKTLKHLENGKEIACCKSPTSKINEKEINVEFNLWEIICTVLCPCCLWKSLKKKHALSKKGIEILFFKLDVLNYLKHMQLLDILNYSLLEPNEKIIVQFLSKPSISLANKKSIYKKIHSIYDIDRQEADELFSAIKELYDKKDKNSFEKRLLKLTKGEICTLIRKIKNI